MDESLVMILVTVLVLACLFGGFIALDVVTCNAQTVNIGMDHHWGLWSGCMIETNPDEWTPLDNYRFMGD
jgi:hypothetical protein